MNIPINKNRGWTAGIYKGIEKLGRDVQAAVMKPAGEACAADIMALCEKYLGKEISTVDELVSGWNILRDRRELTGRWEIRQNTIRGVFGECGCPLIRAGLIELHPAHCYCSQGMMEAIFSRVSHKAAVVEIKRSIGRGEDACDFLITL